MRFILEVTPVDRGWGVTVHGPAAPRLPRRMRRVGEFPQRPEDEPTTDASETALWNQTDPKWIREAFGGIASGTPARGEVALFGRYLFHALLGDDLCDEILEAFVEYATGREFRPADDDDWLRREGILP